MSLLYFRYHQTNCFMIKNRQKDEYLAIDAGWPATLREYQRNLKAIGVDFKKLRLCFVTHYHMDHAGLVGEFIDEGIECFALENQLDQHIDAMERTIAKGFVECTEIKKERLSRVSVEAMNALLEKQGYGGEVLITPGHSPDSISYITSEGEAIIGDLCPLEQIMDDQVSLANWDALRRHGARHILPSHAGSFML